MWWSSRVISFCSAFSPVRDDPVLGVDTRAVHLSSSQSLVEPGDEYTIDEYIDRADKYMYSEKEKYHQYRDGYLRCVNMDASDGLERTVLLYWWGDILELSKCGGLSLLGILLHNIIEWVA